MGSQLPLLETESLGGYVPRAQNLLQHIFIQHFPAFVDSYDERYAEQYGKFRLERIEEVARHFIICGDYSHGIARIRCTDPECGHDYFRPFSCRGFYLCPSCSQKRTLLFSEYLTERLLLRLPHRQFVFSFPKALRVFFKHDRRLFSEVSRLLFDVIQSFYVEAAGRPIRTAAVLAYQSFGDLLRNNPHYHAIVLEGGFDEAGQFVFIPLSDLARMTQYLRRRVVKFFRDRTLITPEFADTLMRWGHSGFSIDNSARIGANDEHARQSLAQYIARPPLSLKKVVLDALGAKVLLKTAYNPYLKENLKLLSATDFIAELTQHIPPKGARYIRYYGLYSSRARGKWQHWDHVTAHAPQGWQQPIGSSPAAGPHPTELHQRISARQASSTWARLIKQVYEVDPLLCPRCGSEMKVIALILDPGEIQSILRHLVKIGRAPPDVAPASLN